MTNRLGRGLDVLMPLKSQAVYVTQIMELPVESIDSSPYQPRENPEEGGLGSLADSIRSVGVLEPILVGSKPAGGYTLIAGERRLRAAKMAGLEKIPAIVKSFGAKESALAGLIENVQRKDLNPMELAQAVERMITEFELTHEEVASSLGMSRPRITNLLRLLGLDSQIREYMALGHLSESQARALLAVDDEIERLKIAKEIAENIKAWSVRDIERKTKKVQRRDPNVAVVEDELERSLGTRVKISLSPRKKTGWISIYFANLEHFERLHKQLKENRAN